LERVEDSLFHGNSALAFDGEAEQWDGLDTMIANANVVDLEGQPLQEADIEEASNLVIESFGYPTDIFLGTRAMSDLVKTFYPRERVQLPAPSEGKVGLNVTSMATQAGTIEFNPDVFIRQGKTPPAAATSANAPASPAVGVQPALGAAGLASWPKSIGAGPGNFAYAATACNRFGESAPVLFQSFFTAVADLTAAENAAGNSIVFTVDNAAVVGANPTEYVIIYRADLALGAAAPADITQYSEIARVAVATQGAGLPAVVFNDTNAIMPFTETAYLGELTPSVLTFRQLAPLMRMDLAVLAPAYRWMVLMYGTPILFAPRKWVRMTNIGRLT